MKKLIGLIVFTIFFISCSAPKKFLVGDKLVTKKRFLKIHRKNYNQAFRKLNKEDKEILFDGEIIIKYSNE